MDERRIMATGAALLARRARGRIAAIRLYPCLTPAGREAPHDPLEAREQLLGLPTMAGTRSDLVAVGATRGSPGWGVPDLGASRFRLLPQRARPTRATHGSPL